MLQKPAPRFGVLRTGEEAAGQHLALRGVEAWEVDAASGDPVCGGGERASQRCDDQAGSHLPRRELAQDRE
ncbi:MAG: hypothetical protein R2736_17105 [Solirubrobacterales bacterium]